MSALNWVVVDAVKQVMRCDRCLTTKPLSEVMGRSVATACRIMDQFVEEHKECQSSPSGQPDQSLPGK